jgi:plastocyanin
VIVVLVSALAITMSGMAVATAFSRAPATNAIAPRSVAMTVMIGEGQVVVGWNDTCNCAVQLDTPAADSEVVAGEYVRWTPDTIVVNAGDTVTLTIKNPRGGDHGFMIEAQAGDFSGTTVSPVIQGRDNSGNPEGTSAVITFTALKPGTYTYICPIPYDEALNHCHPDHETLTGTLIVL